MKFTINRTRLSEVLTLISGNVGKGHNTIFKNILFDGKPDNISIMAANGETSTAYVIDGLTVSEPESILIPANKFISYIFLTLRDF